MDEIIAKFKKSDKACFCAAALIISNVLSIFTTASGFRNLLESFIVGLLLSVVVQAFKLLCEWRITQGPGVKIKAGKEGKAWGRFLIVCAGYALAITFSVLFSTVQFLDLGYSRNKWNAIAQAAVSKGYAEQLQALSDEADAQKKTLQQSIADSLDEIEKNLGAEQAEAALTQEEAAAMQNKYTTVLANDGTTVLFDPDADNWVASLRNTVMAMADGEEVSGLDDYIAGLETKISELDTEITKLMTELKKARSTGANASGTISQQLLDDFNAKNAQRTQYQHIKADFEMLQNMQKRAQEAPAVKLAAAKKACRKALLTDPGSLAVSVHDFIEAAAEYSSEQTKAYTALRMNADTYVTMTELETYCSSAKTADHKENWRAAVQELRDKAAQLPEDSDARKTILRKLDKLTATYLSGELNSIDRSTALLWTVPAEYRLGAYGLLLVAILVDALSIIANLSWPQEDEETV